MTLRLFLMRHCKSDWGNSATADEHRPLSERGRRDALNLGRWLAECPKPPTQVLSSDSSRTRETWALAAQGLGVAPQVEWRHDLYLAPAQGMLDVLRSAGREGVVLMLGHNPGIAQFADMLLGTPPRHHRFRDYPTGATTVIDFAQPRWADVDWGTGTAVDFVIPAEL